MDKICVISCCIARWEVSDEVERAADVMRQLLREGLEAGGHFVPNAQLIITQEEIVLTDANQQHKVKIN